MVLESVTEDTIRELLKDSRATSSTSLRLNGHNPTSDQMNDANCADCYEEDSESAMYSSDVNLTDHHKQLNNVLHNLQQQNAQEAITRRSSAPSRNSRQDRSPERRPFLPEIDPTGSMATVRPNNLTRLNNEGRPPTSGRSSAVTVRNTFSDVNPSLFTVEARERNHRGFCENTPTPPQPQLLNSGRSANSSANVTRPRTLSPIVKNSLDL